MKRNSVLLIIAILGLSALPPNNSQACTNFLITKGASVDNSTYISYSADSHVLYGELYFWTAATYPQGTMMDIKEWDTGKYLGKIKQAAQTYKVVGNINENQVSIGETTFGGLPQLQDTTGIMDYGSLIYIGLQRATNARDAIRIMSELVAEYGYYSSGESFSIADPNEAWILEMIGKGVGNKGAVWVAVKIPDGYISGHANQARITTFPLNDPDNVMYSPDVISFAREKELFKGKDKDFSFSDIYAPLDFSAARFCEARVWSGFNKVNNTMSKYLDYAMGENLKNRMPLYVKPDNKLTTADVFSLMRDYYQGTPMDMSKDPGAGPYENIIRWRPLTWEVDGKTYFNERAISTQQTGFSFVAQMRSQLPNPIGGILWFGVDDTYTTVYSPMYCGITEVPQSFAVGKGAIMRFDPDAAFWVFNQVSNFAYTRFDVMIKDIQKIQSELENNYFAFTSSIDDAALKLYNKDKDMAIKFLTNYSVNTGNNTVEVWKRLYAHLFTRYMDGNIKTYVPGEQNPAVDQPGYSEGWYKQIIEGTGNKFLYKGEVTH